MKTRIIPALGGVALVAGTVLAAPLAASAADYVPDVNGPTTSNTVVVPDPGKSALADTGSTVPIELVVAGGAIVVLGASIVVVARHRRKSA